MEAIAPGSIKAKILEAILELGHAATSAAIRKRHPSNEHLVNLSIDQLTAAGLIEVTSEGNWQLTATAKKAMRGQSVEGAAAAIASQRKVTIETLAAPAAKPVPPPAPPRRAPASSPEQPAQRVAATEQSAPESFASAPVPPPPSPPSPPPITAQEVTAVAKITCNKCSTPKEKSEYYAHNPRLCKRCILDRQKELRDGAAKPAKRAAKAAGAVRADGKLPVPTEFLIPASGSLVCTVAEFPNGRRYSIEQDGEEIVCNADQLQKIVNWASGQLKARG